MQIFRKKLVVKGLILQKIKFNKLCILGPRHVGNRIIVDKNMTDYLRDLDVIRNLAIRK